MSILFYIIIKEDIEKDRNEILDQILTNHFLQLACTQETCFEISCPLWSNMYIKCKYSTFHIYSALCHTAQFTIYDPPSPHSHTCILHLLYTINLIDKAYLLLHHKTDVFKIMILFFSLLRQIKYS